MPARPLRVSEQWCGEPRKEALINCDECDDGDDGDECDDGDSGDGGDNHDPGRMSHPEGMDLTARYL